MGEPAIRKAVPKLIKQRSGPTLREQLRKLANRPD
jgi:hypothetical protein